MHAVDSQLRLVPIQDEDGYSWLGDGTYARRVSDVRVTIFTSHLHSPADVVTFAVTVPCLEGITDISKQTAY